MTFPRSLFLAALALFLGGTFAAGASNILLIIADDYGIDSSSLYNTSAAASQPPTPNLASLAAGGVRFTSAYAYPLCSPTRASILTGRYGFRTGVGNVVSTASGNSLAAEEQTLPEAFTAAASGYALAHFGKWHLTVGPGNLTAPNTIGGWPHFAGSLPGALASYTNWTKVVNGTQTTGYTTYATTDVVNDATAWITARGTQPWLAWVAFNAPHTPFHKPPNDLHSYDALPGTTAHINANPRAYFEAMTEAMDTEIGRLLSAVDLARTTVIFIGDNGTQANVLQPPFPAGRGKDTLFEGGMRVPMIVAGAGVASPGRTSGALVHVVDLFATIVELAGLPPVSTARDSHSFAPVLRNEAHAPIRLYSESFDQATPTAGGRVIRDERFKLIKTNAGTSELYDLTNDPYEQADLLAGALSAEAQQHFDRLRYWLAGYTTTAAPAVISSALGGGVHTVTVAQTAGATYTLWRCGNLADAFWAPVVGATQTFAGANVTLKDPAPPAGAAFYSVLVELP
jgi:arylsulfatase A-like enzyme